MKRTGVVKGTRGAVLAEFIIAFMPIMTIFMCMCQLVHLFTMREILFHAANATARACAVINDPNNNQPGGDTVNGPQKDGEQAGRWALQPWKTSSYLTVDKVECLYQEPNDTYGQDVGHISATYRCTVPIAKNIVCPGGIKTLDIQSDFPHQGAKYKMP